MDTDALWLMLIKTALQRQRIVLLAPFASDEDLLILAEALDEVDEAEIRIKKLLEIE